MTKDFLPGQANRPSSGTSLYWHRAKEQFLFDLSLWKSSLDWTVWVYIFIPLLMVGVYHYMQMINGKAWWAEDITGTMVAVVLSLFALSGRIRIFLHPSDQLFLWQEKSLINSLNKWGLIHFYLKSFLTTFLLGLLLSPFLHLYLHLRLLTIAQLLILLWLAKGLCALLKRMVDLSFKPITAYIIRGLMWGMALLLFLIVISLSNPTTWLSILFAGCSALLCRLHFKKPLPFDQACKLEAEEKMKYVRLLLAQSAFLGAPLYVTGKRARQRAKPLLFRRSQAFFSHPDEVKGVVELILKSFLRNLSWMTAYFQVTSLATFGLLMLPLGLKLFLWVIILFALTSILRFFWREVMEHPFLTVLPCSQMIKQKAGRQALFYLLLPAGIWLGGLCGYFFFSFWGILPFVGLGLVLIYGAVRWHVSTLF